jgi:hypothetical protein
MLLCARSCVPAGTQQSILHSISTLIFNSSICCAFNVNFTMHCPFKCLKREKRQKDYACCGNFCEKMRKKIHD